MTSLRSQQLTGCKRELKAFPGMAAEYLFSVHPDDRQAVKEIWQNTVVDLKQDVHLFEFRWLHADGKVIW